MDKSLAGTDTTNGFWSQADNSQQNPNGFQDDGTTANTNLQPLHPLIFQEHWSWTRSLSELLHRHSKIYPTCEPKTGGVQSRLSFNLESITQQKTNMRAALGRVVDVDIAEESTNLAKYSILNQAAASMLAQANASTDVALMLLR